MKEQFGEVFEEIFLGSVERFKKATRKKQEAIDQCQKHFKQQFFDAEATLINRAVTFKSNAGTPQKGMT